MSCWKTNLHPSFKLYAASKRLSSGFSLELCNLPIKPDHLSWRWSKKTTTSSCFCDRPPILCDGVCIFRMKHVGQTILAILFGLYATLAVLVYCIKPWLNTLMFVVITWQHVKRCKTCDQFSKTPFALLQNVCFMRWLYGC